MTGAGRGMGAAIAKLAGARGFAVAVNFASRESATGEVVGPIVSADGRAVALRADMGWGTSSGVPGRSPEPTGSRPPG